MGETADQTGRCGKCGANPSYLTKILVRLELVISPTEEQEKDHVVYGCKLFEDRASKDHAVIVFCGRCMDTWARRVKEGEFAGFSFPKVEDEVAEEE